MLEVTIDNYKINGIIGRGGMGAIYYGEDLTLTRPVAIKMVRPELLQEPRVEDRFRSEAITTAKLNHPNVATVYELLQQNRSLMLIMEFVSGWTLSQVLRICRTVKPQHAIAIIQSALAGIGYAHKQGVIHRDLKPTNLMLNDNGHIKVMDFGIARVLSGPKFTRTGQLVGTLKYMPPEQIQGKETDSRTDIYALGIVMYKLLTGRVPFSAGSDYQLMKAQVENPPPPLKKFTQAISDQLQTTILKALAKSSRDRYATAEEFAAALSLCPESQTTDKGKLDELVGFMQERHPITTTPLNRQVFEALMLEIQSESKSTKGWQHFKSTAGNIRRTLIKNNPFKKFRTDRPLHRYILVSFFAVAVFVFVFWFFFQYLPKTNQKNSISGFEIQTTVTVPIETENSGSAGTENMSEEDNAAQPSLEQGENKEWVIKRN